MALTKVTGKGITDSALTEDKLGPASVTNTKIGTDAVTSAKIQDGQVSADDLASTLDLSSKTVTLPSSATVTIDQNIALLGFKMAVNDGLTVFNLVDGVVDEFNDESGTDEAEGTNDYYSADNDFYTNNCSPICVSAGFTTTSTTEPDTSTAGTNPTQGSGTPGTFTVPSGLSSLNVYAWGGGGGNSPVNPPSPSNTTGGGGGFASGVLAVTPGQSLTIMVAEKGSHPFDNTYAIGGCYPGAPGEYKGAKNGGAGMSYVGGPVGPAPNVMLAAGGGGSSGTRCNSPACTAFGGGGGGLSGGDGGCSSNPGDRGESGSQVAGGTGGSGPAAGQAGGFLYGGTGIRGGGAGYYGGGGGADAPGSRQGGGGGGSSYYGHPQITCGATEGGNNGSISGNGEGGGVTSPFYVDGTNEAASNPSVGGAGEDGYILLTGGPIPGLASPGGGSSTIVSGTFTSTSVPTSARIVVFEENVDTPTLNTDIIASITRDGTNFTNATLSDSGYVTGSSGQRILTGQADISGQPSGQSMRWKLALANNTVKIHGVALQWS